MYRCRLRPAHPLALGLVFSWLAWGGAFCRAEGVTWIVTSDCHYDAFENEDRNRRVQQTVLEMNAIAQRSWPEPLGGDPIERPRGVLVLGDVIDDGDRLLDGRHQTPVQYAHFLADFGLDGSDGLLEYPQYTRPARFRDWEVPEVLRSGDHAKVARWRRAQALARTAARRPDLIEARGGLTDEERDLIGELADDAESV